jgi:hypothetical protein
MDATDQDTKPLRRVGRPRKMLEGADAGSKHVDVVAFVDSRNGKSNAQIYAERVWSGQSPDVPVAERLSRVRAALAGQSLDCAGVTLDGNKL